MAASSAYRYVPDICRNYNTKTCNRQDCTRPHLCYKYFHPSSYCKNGKDCDFSHNIFNPQAKTCLQKAGFNTRAKPGDVKKEYVAALKTKEETLTAGSRNAQRILGRHQSQMIPQLCRNYNFNLCDNQDVCHLIHLCQGYVEGNCPKSHLTCEFSHDIFGDMVKARLKQCGLNVEQKPREVLMEYRRALRLTAQPQRRLADQMRSVSAMDVRLPKTVPSKQGHPRRPQSQERDTSSQRQSSSKVDKALAGEAVGRSKRKDSTPKPACQESRSPQKSASSMPKSLHVSVFEDADICLYFLTGKCAYGESCKNHHQLLPYVWQYRTLQQGVKWGIFSKDNIQLLEQSYCNVRTEDCSVIVEGQMFTVNFNTMTAMTTDTSMSIPVRRLSTASYVNENKDQLFATKWKWYWESDEGWVPCGQKSAHENNEIRDLQTKLEQAYQTDQTEFSVKISGFPYSIDFSNMKQKNVKSRMERRLRRRPTFLSPEEVKNAARLQELAAQKFQRDSSATVSFPREWAPMESEEMKTVDIPDSSKDYTTIRDIFRMSMPNASILVIKRVQNRTLWIMFRMKAEKLKREYGSGVTIERRLFHGTIPDAVDGICELNFDWRLYGSAVGSRYGKGAYFAVQASKADGYVKPDKDGLRFMFYARVLVGKTTKGDKKMRRPPSVDEENPNKLFDSCSDDPQNPSQYVLFDKEQYYPEFIICYKVNED